MSVISKGTPPPPIPGVDLTAGPRALYFYKVTCPVCQMTAPIAEMVQSAYPGMVAAVGQDPPEKLEAFASEYGWSIASTPDLPPYEVSNAYGIEVVPTVVLVNDGKVFDVVESWDRDAWNHLSTELAELTGSEPITLSAAGDGLPVFRPG